jgi:hypothetical protein
MITSVTLQFREKCVRIVVRVIDTHRVVEAVCEGATVVSRAVGEGEVDTAVKAIIDELTAKERESTVVRHTVRHGKDTFIIEVWRVERAFRSCVKLDGEIIDGVVAWDDLGAIAVTAGNNPAARRRNP